MEQFDFPGVGELLHCNTLQEFLSAIDPLHNRYGKHSAFRGVSTLKHQLVPTALRNNGMNSIAYPFLEPLADALQFHKSPFQWIVEFKMLRSFYEKLNDRGLPIPDDSIALREAFLDHGGGSLVPTKKDELNFWPPKTIDGLLALAQHYGLPTRLLDWTWSPHHAAYFAAQQLLADDAVREPGQRLAVWSLNTMAIKIYGNAGWSDRKIETVTVANAGNPNLNAQRGLFTILRSKICEYNEIFDRKPLNEQFSEMVGGIPQEHLVGFGPIFSIVTLPQDLAIDLSENLQRLGISAATLFPGFQGVADSVMEDSIITRARHKNK